MTAAVTRPRADVLLRRQVFLMVATVALMLGAVALLRWHASIPNGVRYARVGDRIHLQTGDSESARLIMRLAMAQVALCGVLAVVALGHAAGVIRYVFFRKEAN